ncbi:MAG: radical SAM protein, partial [Deltaproteobacteria bacterium]|nr:radical SAM protein [Deltaproteobacteria bacterium]
RLECSSIHIGGGEPFLNLSELEMVVETCRRAGIWIEYAETNSVWYKGLDSACEILSSLKEKGLSALLVSMSPFHNEHIPFFKVKGVMEACRAVGINVFPWISDFYDEMDAFDDRKTHTLSDYEDRYGKDYLVKLPSRYWIHPGGRALKTYSRILELRPYEDIVSSDPGGCRELTDVSHFHVDLFGNYIPGLCSGLAIHYKDLGDRISPDRYPFLHTLFRKGISGLLDTASTAYGFKPLAGYISKCHLCFEIRRYLVRDKGIKAREFQPDGFYEHS